MEYQDYDRIDDILMYMSKNVTLEFVTTLSKKMYNGSRRFYHYETNTAASVGSGTTRSIKRNMNYYFVINDREDFGNGLILREGDARLLAMTIEQKILPWYFGTEEQRAFNTLNGKLILGQFSPVPFATSFNKYIIFEPALFTYETGDETKQGIKMKINNAVVDLTIDNLMRFYSILQIDMYIAAIGQCNYAKMQPYGINEFVMSGLGGGRVQDNWNDTPDVGQTTTNFINDKKNQENNFLNNSKKKKG